MRFLMAAVAAALLATSVGCQTCRQGCGPSCAAPACGACPSACDGCDCGPCCDAGCGDCCGCDCCGGSGCNKCCGGAGCGPFGGAGDPSMCPCGPGDSVYDFTPGPAGGQVAYPYYTTRGPRDFLMANPPSIGPGGAYDCR